MPRITHILVLMLVLLTASSAPGAAAGTDGPVEALFVPWGNGESAQLSYRSEPGNRLGPLSFHVSAAGEISVLDPLARQLKVYCGGELVRRLSAPAGARDFLITPDVGTVFLARNGLHLYRADKRVASYRPDTVLPLIRRVSLASSAVVVTRDDGSRVWLSRDLGLSGEQVAGSVNQSGFRAVKASSSAAYIELTDRSGRRLDTVQVLVPGDNLGGLRVVGEDDQGRIFLDVDLIRQAAPLAVQREVWLISRQGEVQGRIRIPTHYYTWMFRDLELKSDGSLYHMISAADGLHLFKWDTAGASGGGYLGEYPTVYQDRVHYNLDLAVERPAERSIRDLSDKSAQTVTVTRNQAISTGDTYVQHLWTATAANLTDGVEIAPDGDLVQTPDWIVVGLNQAVPYKWGGYNTLSYFDSGIAAGYYAGDIHTDGFSAYARGVDCSGFVCRCWNTDDVYTTTEMVDPTYGPITLPLADWANIQAGDAIHRIGHVRMAVAGLQDGSILVVESAGTSTDWRVGYSTYTLAELEGYTPRYYIGMDGALPSVVSAGSGSWTAGGTWFGGVVPTSLDDVLIRAGHTISVDDTLAVCRNLNFGADEALIDLNAGSMLTVHGDFTLFSPDQTVFSAGWSATSAFIRFAGAADQFLSGFNPDGGSTSFRDVIVDKTGGTLATAGGGQRLGIQNSLEIINGVFELGPGDDLEGRWASTGNYRGENLPNIIIRSGGEFRLADGDGAHHMRSDYNGGVQTPIGLVTIFGSATFRDGSTYRIRLSGVDVEAGGKLITSLGMGGGEFECGPLQVKSGAELENYTTTDCWGASAIVTVADGGLFDTKASTTVFPSSFFDFGTVRYSRDATTDQVVADRNYHNLEISLDGDNDKIWTLAGDRTVSGVLKINYGANLRLAASAPVSLTIGTLLNLTSGRLDNSDPEARLVMATDSMIQRAAGLLVSSPIFAGDVDLRYTSTSLAVTTGPEVPLTANVLRNFTLDGDQGVSLGADLFVEGVCSIAGSDLVTGPFAVTIGPAANLVEAEGTTVIGTVTATRAVEANVAEEFGGIGLEVIAAGTAPGLTQVVRTTGVALAIGGADGIERYFDLAVSNNVGLDATTIFHYDETELNGLAEETLGIHTLADGGADWTGPLGSVDVANNTVTATGLPTLARLTAGQGSVTATSRDELPLRTALVKLYPNPFNPTTRIVMNLAGPGPVAVAIYDLKGQEVARLARGVLAGGRHVLTWHGQNRAGRPVASGIYFCRMQADGRTETRKMVLTK